MRNTLREERRKRGMTQKQVADLLGISERGYKFIEYGQRTGSIEIWDKLEDLFNVHQRLLRQNFDPKDSQL
jgi:DNA-binding XRE family transcriptional regulator